MDASEIAEDFKEALQDLKVNSKPEIDNLTVIAKESTPFAQAISAVLEKHIETTRPEWKLPALYVLDSLLRHVGPPYSTYLGQNLFRTFMEAYRQVPNNTRRDMENMLATWKRPPVGSHDSRPVLAPEITDKLESALSRFRTVALQTQPPAQTGLPGQFLPHQGMNGMPPVDMNQLMGQLQQRTGTPTFSQINHIRGPPVVSSPIPHQAIVASHGNIPSHNGTPVNYGHPHYPPAPIATPQTQTSPLQVKLENDVKQLLSQANLQRILDSTNQDMPLLISTLESLKTLLDTQKYFKETDLIAMQGELSKISARLNTQISSLLGNQARNTPPPVQAQSMPLNPYPVVSTPPTVIPFMPPFSIPPQMVPTPTPSTAPPQVDVASLLSLLGPAGSQRPTPIPLPVPPRNITPLNSLARPSPQIATPPPAANNLLEQLRMSGLLGSPQQALNLPVPHAVPPPLPAGSRRYGVRLDQESITKVNRKHLIASLYEANPDQCRQCGRRFPNTKEGKERKIKHLDWHFSVKSRVADATRTGIVHRSPYLDEIQWTRLRESQDDAESAFQDPTDTLTASKGPAEIFIPAPTDVTKLNEPCSICMERFTSIWHEKTQQPVWMDAIKIGNKYYHANCYKEVYGTLEPALGGGSGSVSLGVGFKTGGIVSNRSTPESVLGKRKYQAAV